MIRVVIRSLRPACLLLLIGWRAWRLPIFVSDPAGIRRRSHSLARFMAKITLPGFAKRQNKVEADSIQIRLFLPLPRRWRGWLPELRVTQLSV